MLFIMENQGPLLKAPRTPKLEYTEKREADDIFIDDSVFEGKLVTVTLKMDGENTTVLADRVYARSIDSQPNEGRRWIDERIRKARVLPFSISENILNIRVCGENMFYKHTVEYGQGNPLFTPFYAFAVWVGDRMLDVETTLLYLDYMGIPHVPIIYRGVYNREAILNAFKPYYDTHEGFVVRLDSEIQYPYPQKGVDPGFKEIGKFVKKGFVIPDEHWMSKMHINDFYVDGVKVNPWQIY